VSAPAAAGTASFEELELRLERTLVDASARPALERGLDALAAAPSPAGLSASARGARLLWGAAVLPGAERFRAPAARATARLRDEFFDAERGAFRAEPGSRVLPAEGNALAALAFSRAAAAGEPGAAELAARAADFLRDRLFDPLLGLLSADGAAAPEYGLLGDVAWSALAADALGREEFARDLSRVLVRELWDPSRNGFAARIPRPGEAAFERPDAGAEAAALEACARLGQRKAFALGLAAARAAAGTDARALAAVARVSALAAPESPR
jgi:uncharacterized protein YyaL (SSP411 family)